MGCIVAIIALLLPRVAIVLVFLFTRWFESVFTSLLWPLLGFIFLPYTTLAYTAGMIYSGSDLTVGWMILIAIAVVADLAHWSGGLRYRRRRVAYW